MPVSPRCIACDEFQDNCIGSVHSCGKWKILGFDLDRSGVGDVKEPISAGPVKVETRRQKFGRIGDKRQKQALEAIRKLEHLTSRYYRQRTKVTAYTYEWTEQQALDLLRPIELALEKLKSELIDPDTPRESGLIEDTK